LAFVRPQVTLTVLNRSRASSSSSCGRTRRTHVVWFQRRINRTRWATVKVRLNRNLTARFTARLPSGTRWVRASVPQTPGYLRTTSAFDRIR
jgi:hypothetical protein